MRTILIFLVCGAIFAEVKQTAARKQIGREVAVPSHLEDDEEFRIPMNELLDYGRKLFAANWTWQEGAGRPLMKGNFRELSDPKSPLTGARSMNRISGPDANSCAGCHNQPYGHVGGSGDFVTNVFVLGQRFDFLTFDPGDHIPTRGSLDEAGQPAILQTAANMRATTGMFGAGYIEMLARQITGDLQTIRDTVKRGQSKSLVSKGIDFGVISRAQDGIWNTSKVTGLSRLSLISPEPAIPPTLIVRPWHQAGNVVSIREFTNNAFHQHHGLQSTERFGRDTDPDGDGVTNELTRADITAVTLFQAALPVPGRVIPNDPEIEQAVLKGEKVFGEIGCASCHIPNLSLNKKGWIFSEPNPFNPAMNLRTGDTQTIRFDLQSPTLPSPRLNFTGDDEVEVPIFADFKLHDITSGPDDPNAEPLDMNQSTWSPKFRTGNVRFLTKRLWGCANEPPYFHHGRFTTMRESVVAHSGEALEQRKKFQALSGYEQDSLIEFLKTLQVLPPGTKDLIVDENFKKKVWPPKGR
jgi:cytochrome c peroxidase